jgi:hypothetical protein
LNKPKGILRQFFALTPATESIEFITDGDVDNATNETVWQRQIVEDQTKWVVPWPWTRRCYSRDSVPMD